MIEYKACDYLAIDNGKHYCKNYDKCDMMKEEDGLKYCVKSKIFRILVEKCGEDLGGKLILK